jgi:hypothetical protein
MLWIKGTSREAVTHSLRLFPRRRSQVPPPPPPPRRRRHSTITSPVANATTPRLPARPSHPPPLGRRRDELSMKPASSCPNFGKGMAPAGLDLDLDLYLPSQFE